MTLMTSWHQGGISVETASTLAINLVNLESRGGADIDGALKRLEARYGLRAAALDHLRHRRAKTCDVSLFERLRRAYIDLCERQVRRLQTEISISKALGSPDDFNDLAAEVAALALKIERARDQMNDRALLQK